ncbi:PIR protein [Plasmodium sp. DRC-Itaito]|nr:PIR protein [Plasmodium sp. DRC-Itaito]
MKVHYINILLFAFPLNILVNNQRNHYTTNRSLCECDLYMPNYDNDPQMKEVMENFNKQAQQRFREYDDRMVEKRKQCKDKCDKEMQNIILKDKLEKQMAEQFATLDTDIQSDAIPTCVCEKSIADKVEKGCLRCGGVLGGGVMPAFGTIGGTALYALNQLKPTIFKAAIKAAVKAGATEISAAGEAAGAEAGMRVVIFGLQRFKVNELFPIIYNPFVTTKPYTEVTNLANSLLEKYRATCTGVNNMNRPAACTDFQLNLGIHVRNGNTINTYGTPDYLAIPKRLGVVLERAETAADGAAKIARESATNAIKAQETVLLEAGFNSSTASIYVSIIAIVIIVLIMVIIYLILRYRRKKKMKKKLQYIKLLEE